MIIDGREERLYPGQQGIDGLIAHISAVPLKRPVEMSGTTREIVLGPGEVRTWSS